MATFDRRRFLANCAYLTAGAALGLAGPRLAGLLPAAPDAPAAEPTAEERLKKLKLKLPAVARPKATLVPAVRAGDMLYVSGHVSTKPDGKPLVGKVGK